MRASRRGCVRTKTVEFIEAKHCLVGTDETGVGTEIFGHRPSRGRMKKKLPEPLSQPTDPF